MKSNGVGFGVWQWWMGDPSPVNLVINQVRVPTLIVSAKDDPFVPPEQFDDPEVAANPHIAVQVTPYGGHCGYYAGATPGFDGYWAERRIVEFAREHCQSVA